MRIFDRVHGNRNRLLRSNVRIPCVSFFGTICALLLVVSLENPALAQDAGDKSTASPSLVRSCNASQAGLKPGHKNKTKGNAGARADQAALACLEAKGAPLDIQEFFQSYVRAQGWRFGEEKIVADGWIFTRYLDKDELLQFAKEGRFAGRVNWTEGKALVLVTTRELDDSFTRTEVTARLQGLGQNVDRFAPPKDTWDLDSSGLLEKNLIAALEAHFKSLP
jgi:hypothetical protein